MYFPFLYFWFLRLDEILFIYKVKSHSENATKANKTAEAAAKVAVPAGCTNINMLAHLIFTIVA